MTANQENRDKDRLSSPYVVIKHVFLFARNSVIVNDKVDAN